MESVASSIEGPAGVLETLLQTPENARQGELAILCHPLPTEGGNMHNKVIYTMGKCFQELAVATLKMHTRGTGKSEGVFDNGVGEVADLATIVDYCANNGFQHIYLAGFSFGAYISHNYLHVHNSDCVRHVLLVAPPLKLDKYHFADTQPHNAVLTVVQGMQDELVDAMQVEQWYQDVKHAYPDSAFLPFANADHFFHGQLITLRQSLSARLETLI